MAFAWMPKATVQAALGPVFLDNCIKYGKEDWKPMGEEILTLAVLSILITAPLGAVCILGMINISSQLSQLYPAFKLKACDNFCLSREGNVYLAQPLARCSWTTRRPPPPRPGVTRLFTATRRKSATKSENPHLRSEEEFLIIFRASFYRSHDETQTDTEKSPCGGRRGNV